MNEEGCGGGQCGEKDEDEGESKVAGEYEDEDDACVVEDWEDERDEDVEAVEVVEGERVLFDRDGWASTRHGGALIIPSAGIGSQGDTEAKQSWCERIDRVGLYAHG